MIPILLVAATAFPCSPDEPKSPPELGRVRWHTGFDAARSRAKAENKPVFVLFQEIPGCATCKDFGGQVLSHPLLVEAIEDLFVPVVVRNNSSGDDDERVLKTFREKAWNNPVVRIVTPEREDVVPRIDGVYSVDGIAQRLVEALAATQPEAPAYLRLLAEEGAARRHGVERATFGMHCFWEGEAKLGALAGVVQTRPGFIGEVEVVDLEFDPRTISYEKLLDKAREMDCATRIFARSAAQLAAAQRAAGRLKLPEDVVVRSDAEVRPDSQPKYYLSQVSLRYIPMTETQASRVNAALSRGESPTNLLSKRQVERWHRVQSNPAQATSQRKSLIGVDLRTGWESLER